VRTVAKRQTNHSASTGRFVSDRYAASHPGTTVSVTSGARPTNAARDAGTGRFVTDRYAATHPSSTVEGK
jgi:hypothetical protein